MELLMIDIIFKSGDLSSHEQEVITSGFNRHTRDQTAPPFKKDRLNWLALEEGGGIVGALTGDLLWDWLYIDELWVDESRRGTGLGRKLMSQADEYASQAKLTGIWLWTQSWQAAEFYTQLGYEEFARFPDFPKGHARIGFRKYSGHENREFAHKIE